MKGFRTLHTQTKGTAYLHSMPGRYEPIDEIFKQIDALKINRIICLAGEAEIAKKSPDYARAISEGKVPIKRISFPVPDYGTPENIHEFYKLADNTANLLKEGENILVHCAGGIGRTGMFAGCLLKALGLPREFLENSGSGPEGLSQDEIIENFSV